MTDTIAELTRLRGRNAAAFAEQERQHGLAKPGANLNMKAVNARERRRQAVLKRTQLLPFAGSAAASSASGAAASSSASGAVASSSACRAVASSCAKSALKLCAPGGSAKRRKAITELEEKGRARCVEDMILADVIVISDDEAQPHDEAKHFKPSVMSAAVLHAMLAGKTLMTTNYMTSSGGAGKKCTFDHSVRPRAMMVTSEASREMPGCVEVIKALAKRRMKKDRGAITLIETKEELRKAFQENVMKHDAALKHDAPIVQLVCTKPHAKQLRRDLINKTLGDHVVTWPDLFKSLWAAAGVAQ